MNLPWDVLVLLVKKYFHPPEALIAMRLCRRMNDVLQQDKERIIRAMLIHVYRKKLAAADDLNNRYRCEECYVTLSKASMKKHMAKHARRINMPIRPMDTCHNCGTNHPLNEPHDCPCAIYDCRGSAREWARNTCKECPMYKKKWNHIQHDVSVECLYCHEKFVVQFWNEYEYSHEDEYVYVVHWRKCPFKDEITTKYWIP